MFSLDLTLNDFVCPIPICQPGADLGSILNTVQHANCDLLAIPRENGTWGTISSQNLLSLLVQSWQQKCMSMVSHPKKQVSQADMPHIRAQDFNSLIKPGIVYQANTKLKEFLNYLPEGSLYIRENKYLIIDNTGELRGRLDVEKLLRYLALRFNQAQTNIFSLPALSTSLLGLMDSIALPLKIETAEGEDFYTNKCWQELIATNQDIQHQKSQEPDVSVPTWWMKHQSIEHHHAQGSQSHESGLSNAANNKCLSSGFYPISQFDISSTETSLNLPSEKLSSLIEDHGAISSLIENHGLNKASNSPFAIQIEQKTNWNYIKIPLTLATEQYTNPNRSVYRLILATKISLGESEDSQTQNVLEATPETIKDKLLATISHELKSPLTGVVGLSGLLKTQKLGKLNQRQIRYVQLIYRSGQQMMSIVNDLLELTSLTAGKLQLQPERINLESLCHRLYQQTLTKLQSATTEELNFIDRSPPLRLNIEPGLEIAIADESCLSSILSHLISEIIKFSEPFNTLTTEGFQAQDFQREKNLIVKIESIREWTAIIVGNDIEDTSHLKSAVVNLLSSPQDSGSLKQDSSLNLIIAKYLAELLEGDVLDVSSGNSSKFALLLPKSSCQLETIPSISSQESENTKDNVTILCLYPEPEVINPLADDNSSLDFNLKDWAEQNWSNAREQKPYYRHRIIEADGLEQAHTLARIWQLDVIVLDGYQIAEPSEYLRSLQKSEYLSALPLITLDTRTTEAANQIEGLNVYPCLLPAECRSVRDLMQVIQIATTL